MALDDILAMDDDTLDQWLEDLTLDEMVDFARTNEIPVPSWPSEWLDDEYPERQDEMSEAIWEWIAKQPTP